ncbi:MAG TPA: DUF559 domain-containing protein [Rhizomicrobium sp.]|nr:DUF559 domain-containing protein [Rhizomicrobium sp.]
MVSVVVAANRKRKVANRLLARSMRHKPVVSERIFWDQVRDRKLGGYKFKRQYPIGSYIVDFVCLERKLIIELDGPFHAGRVVYDEKRDAYLKACGFEVWRIRNEDLAGDMSGFVAAIRHHLDCGITPSPQPSPPRGRGRSS